MVGEHTIPAFRPRFRVAVTGCSTERRIHGAARLERRIHRAVRLERRIHRGGCGVVGVLAPVDVREWLL
jgi:hypothetical protein